MYKVQHYIYLQSLNRRLANMRIKFTARLYSINAVSRGIRQSKAKPFKGRRNPTPIEYNCYNIQSASVHLVYGGKVRTATPHHLCVVLKYTTYIMYLRVSIIIIVITYSMKYTTHYHCPAVTVYIMYIK